MFKRIALIQILAGGAFLSSFTYIAILANEIGLSRTEIVIMAMIYSFAQFFSSYIFGRLADRFGKRKILLIGLVSLTFLVLIQALGNSTSTLMGFRFLTGIGFGMYPAALAAYAFEARASMGRFSAFNSLGWGSALLIAGPIADIFGVRGVFYMASAMVMISFLIAMGLKPIPEIRIRSPLIPIKLINRNREIIIPFILRHASASSIWVLWPLFLKDEIGLSLIQIGLVQAVNAFTQFGSMFLLGDRISPRKSVGLGLILTSLAVLSFIVVKSFPFFLITQVLLGLSWANLYVGSLRSMLIKNKERASAVGLLNSSISLSALIGPILALVLVELLPEIPYEGPMILAGSASFLAFIYYILKGSKRVPFR